MNTDSRILSPFNIKETIKMDFFSLDETKVLIDYFTVEYSVNVTEEVVQTLYDYTKGYTQYCFN
jgi:hypothetical protein